MTKAAPDPTDAERAGLVHREIFQIGALMLLAVLGFFLTRAVAESNRDATLRDADAWYRRGQEEIAAGRLDAAVESLRRATVRNRYDRRYVLALARALALKNDTEGARAALLTLREAAPEDPEINLELARLAARRQDVTEALRFYHNALYAPWPVESGDARRRARFELIDFLLQHDQASRALSELLAVASDLPDDPGVRVQVAQLFARANDPTHALDQFQRALRSSPDDATALAGAGLSAFRLGNYALAQSYLQRAPADLDNVTHTREVAALVLSRDPLASRIGAAERRRRLTADVEYVENRLAACIAGRRDAAATDEETALQREIAAIQTQLRPATILDQDAIEAGLDLTDRIEQRLTAACGARTAWDEALALIARAHASETR